METRRIFIVDENARLRAATRSGVIEAMRRAGIDHEVLEFRAADEAAACYDGTGAPALILCDKDSGDEDAGLTLLRHVRATGSAIPFILWGTLTGDHRTLGAAQSAVCVSKDNDDALNAVCSTITRLLRGQPSSAT